MALARGRSVTAEVHRHCHDRTDGEGNRRLTVMATFLHDHRKRRLLTERALGNDIFHGGMPLAAG